MPDINVLNLGWQSYLIIVMGCFLITTAFTGISLDIELGKAEEQTDKVIEMYAELDCHVNDFLDALEVALDHLPLTMTAADFIDEVLKNSGFQTPSNN